MFKGKIMKLSDMERVIAEIRRGHGDLTILCGSATIRGFAIYQGPPKIVSVIAWYEPNQATGIPGALVA